MEHQQYGYLFQILIIASVNTLLNAAYIRLNDTRSVL